MESRQQLVTVIDGNHWFTTNDAEVDSHIQSINKGIVEQYVSAKCAINYSTIRVRIDRGVPLLAVKEHFAKQGINLVPAFGYDRPRCKCDNDNGRHSSTCETVAYFLYCVTLPTL